MKQIYKFSIFEALKFAFYTFIEHFGFFLCLVISYLAIAALATAILGLLVTLPFFNAIMNAINVLDAAGVSKSEMIQGIIKHLGFQYIFAISILIFLMCILKRFMDLGFTKISINFYDMHPNTISTLFSCGKFIASDVIATFIYSLLCGLGSLLFIIPGIYCAITFGFYQQCIVDRGLGPLEALQKSAELTQGTKFQLLSLAILLSLLNYAAFVLFGLTLLISWPVTSLAYAYVYRKLLIT